MASSAGLRRAHRERHTIVPNISTENASQNHTRHLVVCGVVNMKDIWLFGDFLGFATTLKEQGVNQTFINVFDLDRYFRETGFKNVKFGKREEIAEDWDSDDQMVIYTQWEWEHRSPWWTQIKSEQANNLVTEVLTWIHKQASEVKLKDIISIILIGHGDKNGIVLGGRHLRPADLAAACSSFPADVQVNIVIKACYSGLFANAFKVANQRNIYIHTSAQTCEKSYSTPRSISGRLQNSHFGQAFIRTLGLTRDPDEIWTLQKQKSYIHERLNRPDIPQTKRSTPVVISDSPVSRLMKEILYHDYLDISFSNAPVRARRVLSPTNDALLLLRQREQHNRQHVPGNVEIAHEYEAAGNMIGSEMNLLDLKYAERGDEGVTTDWCTLNQRPYGKRTEVIVELAYVTWFRWKIQEQFFFVAAELIYNGLISLDAVYTPMNLSQQTQSISTVLDALRCFSIPRSCMDYEEEVLGTHFFAPPHWLATLIVRSCSDWRRIIGYLITVPLLGELDSELMSEIVKKRPKFTVNPDEGKIGEAICNVSKPPSYAFWLPHGIRLEAFLPIWTKRHSQVMEAYYVATGRHWERVEDIERTIANLIIIERESDK
jgi:hypothetical protein